MLEHVGTCLRARNLLKHGDTRPAPLNMGIHGISMLYMLFYSFRQQLATPFDTGNGIQCLFADFEAQPILGLVRRGRASRRLRLR